MNCPLCAGAKTRLQTSVEVAAIVSRWSRDLGIDVRSEFGEVTAIELHACADCAIQFFQPDSVAGSPAIYMALENHEEYYIPCKWEHDMALRDMEDARNGVEIGCGFGSFVERVQKERGIPFYGCEQNSSAVRKARSNGVDVRLEDSSDLAKRSPGAYDVVCSFQVLEHVIHPGEVLQSFCDLLRPGGKLLLGLPNAASFLKYQFNPLDLPPHHMTRWRADVLRRLQAWFPLKLMRIAYEPLPEYQVRYYAEAYLDFLQDRGLGLAGWPGIRSRIVKAVSRPDVRRFLRGQTFYASYMRI